VVTVTMATVRPVEMRRSRTESTVLSGKKMAHESHSGGRRKGTARTVSVRSCTPRTTVRALWTRSRGTGALELGCRGDSEPGAAQCSLRAKWPRKEGAAQTPSCALPGDRGVPDSDRVRLK